MADHDALARTFAEDVLVPWVVQHLGDGDTLDTYSQVVLGPVVGYLAYQIVSKSGEPDLHQELVEAFGRMMTQALRDAVAAYQADEE